MSAWAGADDGELLPWLSSDGPDSAQEHGEAGGASPKGAVVALFSVAAVCACAAAAAPGPQRPWRGGAISASAAGSAGHGESPAAGNASDLAEVWDEYAGYDGMGRNLLLYDAQHAPCDVDELKANLELGMGYFLNPGVSGVMCGGISAGNVCSLKAEHDAWKWSRNASGTTYLPDMKVYAGWGPNLNDEQTAPCDVDGFRATLTDSMGYFFDHQHGRRGLCKSISAEHVARLWDGRGSWTRSARGRTYLPYCYVVDTTDRASPHTESERQPWQSVLAVALSCAYLALVAYNIYTAWLGTLRLSLATSDTEEQGKFRCNVWDAIKFVLMTGVIFFHCAFYLSAEDLRGWTIHRVVLRPVVPCFVFVSGVFGADVSPKALWRAAFYPWPCVLGIGGILAARCVDGHAASGFNGFGYWYLWCLCFWRLTVSPLVCLVRRQAGTLIVLPLLVALQLLVCALLSSTGSYDGPWRDVWRCFLFYAPIFAAGQLLEPTSWRDAFSGSSERARLRLAAAASAAFVVLWYLLFAVSSGFRRWNTAYCADEETCQIFNYGVPEDILNEPIGVASLWRGVATLALRLGIILAYLGLLGAGLCELEAACPRAVSCAAGWGERSLFAYVLSHIWLELVMAAGGREALDVAPASCFPALCFALALQATVVLSSEGTASLARRVLVPPWL